MIIGYERRICAFKNCSKLTRNKGFYEGQTRYDKWCELHHRLRLKNNPIFTREFIAKQTIDNSKCEQCGWDKATCDRHRIEKNKGYAVENVKVLCPNCHRLAHLGQ